MREPTTDIEARLRWQERRRSTAGPRDCCLVSPERTSTGTRSTTRTLWASTTRRRLGHSHGGRSRERVQAGFQCEERHLGVIRHLGAAGLREERLAEVLRAVLPADLGEARELDTVAEGIPDRAAEQAAEDAVNVGERLARLRHGGAAPDVVLLPGVLDRARSCLADAVDRGVWSEAELDQQPGPDGAGTPEPAHAVEDNALSLG